MPEDEKISIAETARTLFDSIKHTTELGNEYWLARELATTLGYTRWENFENVIKKAKTSVVNSGETVDNHFRDDTKMVEVGSNTVRPVKDFKLSRYACYVISQNGNPSKTEIALAQAYFAQQTRLQEVGSQHIKETERLEARDRLAVSDKELSSTVMGRGVDARGLAFLKSHGDKRLFGGKSTQDMKDKYGIASKSKPLADHLPTISLTAKQLANEMTTINTNAKDLHGPGNIGVEHLKNNDEIRKSLLARGIKLEDLPPEEDIEQVKRRLQTRQKKQLDSDSH